MQSALSESHLANPKLRALNMALLARAPQSLLQNALQAHIPQELNWLRKPETGLMMVRGRVGGNGEAFNLGEITVTRCAIKIKDSQLKDRVGVAYVLGRSKSHALLASLADALLQDENKSHFWQETLITPIQELIHQRKKMKSDLAQETKVDFYTLAREAGKE